MVERARAVLMSAVFEQPAGLEILGQRGLALRDLAEWILEDGLPVTMQTRLHKFIWDPQTRGVDGVQVDLVKSLDSRRHWLPCFPEGHKCRRMHGHSFRVDVVVRGEIPDDRGYLIDFADIKKLIARSRKLRPLLSRTTSRARESDERSVGEVDLGPAQAGTGPARRGRRARDMHEPMSLSRLV